MTNTLVNLIMKKLEQSSIYNKDEKNPNILLFSDEDINFTPPYIVVKPEQGVIKDTRSFRIIVHMKKGFADQLSDFVLNELNELLLTEHLYDEEGKTYKLYSNGYTDITPEKEDNTFFMERLLYSPMLLR